jgi:hypothetical protein
MGLDGLLQIYLYFLYILCSYLTGNFYGPPLPLVGIRFLFLYIDDFSTSQETPIVSTSCNGHSLISLTFLHKRIYFPLQELIYVTLISRDIFP